MAPPCSMLKFPGVTCRRLLDRLRADRGAQRDRPPPCQNAAYVSHSRTTARSMPPLGAMRGRRIGRQSSRLSSRRKDDVHRPSLIGPRDRQLSRQMQMRADLVPWCRFRCVWPAGGVPPSRIRSNPWRLPARPMRSFGGARCSRQTSTPSRTSSPCSIRPPVNGNSMRSLSIRCIGLRSASDTGQGFQPTRPRHNGLTADAQPGGWIDPFLAIGSRPASTRARPARIILQRSPSELRMQGLQSNGRLWLGILGLPEHPGCPLEPAIPPRLDRVGIDLELLRRRDHGLLAHDRGDRPSPGGKTIPRIVSRSASCLECRAVMAARSSCHALFLPRSNIPPLPGKATRPGVQIAEVSSLLRGDRKTSSAALEYPGKTLFVGDVLGHPNGLA